MDINEVKSMWDSSAQEQRKFMLDELQKSGQAWRDLLRSQLSAQTAGEALDIACGTGFLAILLAELGYRVTAIDSSAAMLEEAKSAAKSFGLAGKIKFVEMDAAELNFPAETFDVIVSKHASWLFEKPEMVYQSCFKSLKKGGTLLNFDANWLLPLRDAAVKQKFEADEKMLVAQLGKFEDYYHNDAFMAVLNQLPLADKKRPDWDKALCHAIGFEHIAIQLALPEHLWNPFFALRYRQLPTFLIRAEK